MSKQYLASRDLLCCLSKIARVAFTFKARFSRFLLYTIQNPTTKREEPKRLPGLIAHAKHPISTGKLEGFNNKIKVAKRIGYGYRNMEYFFTLIKYMSLPAVRKSYRTASSVKVT